MFCLCRPLCSSIRVTSHTKQLKREKKVKHLYNALSLCFVGNEEVIKYEYKCFIMNARLIHYLITLLLCLVESYNTIHAIVQQVVVCVI